MIFLDISVLLHRAVHTLSTAPDVAGYELAKDACELVRHHGPNYGGLAVVRDAKPSWRRIMTPTYKANRPVKSPEEIKEFAELEGAALQGFRNARVPVLRADEMEADDVMFMMSRREGQHLLVTTDTDLSMALRPNVHLLIKNKVVELGDLPTLKQSAGKPWGCRSPLEVFLYKATVGDPGDGYNGVNRLGSQKWFEALESGALDSLDYAELVRNTREYTADLFKETGLKFFHLISEDVQGLQLAMSLARLRTDFEVEVM